ncbi:MAG: hypothetical protein IPI43_27445 [Sandaracinaceae bacterium]|nr:hypothetical protein [Sandaracinaceae bacterium]
MDAAFAFTSGERFLGAVGGDAAGSACALPYRNGAAPEVALFGAPFHDADAFDAGIVYGENFTTNNAETALRPDGVASNPLRRARRASTATARPRSAPQRRRGPRRPD